MRICVSGTCSQGKSTFIEDFLKEWPNYSTPKKTYRSFVKNKHSKKATKDIQWKILNSMIDELQKHDSEENIIYDRGPLDNLVHTLWSRSKNLSKIDDKFVKKTITLVRESLKHLDMILYIPITRVAAVDYDTEEFLKDKHVLSMKQSYLSFPELTDFHFFNCSNLPITDNEYLKRHYDYNNEFRGGCPLRLSRPKNPHHEVNPSHGEQTGPKQRTITRPRAVIVPGPEIMVFRLRGAQASDVDTTVCRVGGRFCSLASPT